MKQPFGKICFDGYQSVYKFIISARKPFDSFKAFTLCLKSIYVTLDKIQNRCQR